MSDNCRDESLLAQISSGALSCARSWSPMLSRSSSSIQEQQKNGTISSSPSELEVTGRNYRHHELNRMHSDGRDDGCWHRECASSNNDEFSASASRSTRAIEGRELTARGLASGAGATFAKIKAPLLALVLLAVLANHIQSTRAAPQAPALDNTIGTNQTTTFELADDSARSEALSMRDSHDSKLKVNTSQILEIIFKKKPYSKYWSPEQKWNDLFMRFVSVQDSVKQIMLKNVLRDAEYYADLSLTKQCQADLKYIQEYSKVSSNFRWLLHMLDSAGKSEPGMLTGNLAHMGHVVQCIKVRAPARPSNDSFDERFFEQQTSKLGERFRGKYCLASIRPVLPAKPRLVSRFSLLLNVSLMSNISYMGEPSEVLKQRTRQLTVPASARASIDRQRPRLDQVPFESELYNYLIEQRNFMFTLPRYIGSCYPSSCSNDDIRMVLQKTMDDQHQVVDIEFECEKELHSLWEWLSTPRLLCYVLLATVVIIVVGASLVRHILVDRMQINRAELPTESRLTSVLDAVDMLSIDKCAGILFVKTKRASPCVDWTKVENNRSTSIDALRGLLILLLVYSQLVVLGCLPVPFMWSKWSDAMFPFYRSPWTQMFLNMSIWSEAFYIISGYLIGAKFLENLKPRSWSDAQDAALYKPGPAPAGRMQMPDFFSFALKRYVRLVMPMLAFIVLNYVWPQLSSGFVMQDQANKIMSPCDTVGWTNLLMFHNYQALNETCLWPSHVSASFFQLHLISYPILWLCAMCLYNEFGHGEHQPNVQSRNTKSSEALRLRLMQATTYAAIACLALVGAIYPALKASRQELIVPFLIDYIDYDNYQRVLEWTVLPTYNHLTGYMFGLLVAFVIVQKRLRGDSRPTLLSDSWFYNDALGGATGTATNVINLEGSLESMRSSSTEGIVATFQRQPATELAECKLKFSPSTCTSSTNEQRASLHEESTGRKGCLCRLMKSLIAALAALAPLLLSWLWNGLGEPMDFEQTFWYVLLTKLTFCSAFAYIFYKHFARRRNCNNPWMVTRFLVPIGRMSLTVFYLSWLVIWFDLLSSPYQWHPSHYFVFEKFTEIIVITLILAMLVYAAFEGIIKRVQYVIRSERVERDKKYLAAVRVSARHQANQLQLRHQQVKSFESFFDPSEKKMMQDGRAKDDNQARQGKVRLEQSALHRQQGLIGDSESQLVEKINTTTQQVTGQSSATAARFSLMQARGYQVPRIMVVSQRDKLSTVDQSKLNAELRANCSFASIGLYESAGAVGDLSRLHGSQASFDPSESPAQSRAAN